MKLAMLTAAVARDFGAGYLAAADKCLRFLDGFDADPRYEGLL